jgi:hypothetical protein
MKQMFRLAIACALIFLSFCTLAQQKKNAPAKIPSIAKPFELKGIKVDLTESQIEQIWQGLFKCNDNDSNTSIYSRKCELQVAGITPLNHDLATIAGQPVMAYSLYLLSGKVKEVTVSFNSTFAAIWSSASYRPVRDALVERYGKPTDIVTKQFIMRRAQEQSWEVVTWKTKIETLELDEQFLNSGIFRITLKDNNVESEEEALRKRESQRNAKDL